jgi:hypothetical protein
MLIWSPTGEYTYINQFESFYILATKSLSIFLDGPVPHNVIHIYGHPLGAIAQIAWIGNNMIYETGISEGICGDFITLSKEKTTLSTVTKKI